MLFDRLRKGALSFFRDDDTSDSGPGLEAKQLEELVFRRNADVLYAREQPHNAIGQSTFETMFPEVDMETLGLDTSADVLGLFNFFNSPSLEHLEDFSSTVMDDTSLQVDFSDTIVAGQTPSSTVSRQQPMKALIDAAHLRASISKLPICSHCKRRRIKCDAELPACRNCSKLRKKCVYWDTALDEETSREYELL